MFTHSTELPTTLLKMNRKEQKRCMTMFNQVLAWTALSNAKKDKRERDDVLSDIKEIAGTENSENADELVLQLVKQTRGNPNQNHERNTWKLLKIVVDTYVFSEKIQDFVIEYLRSVARQGSAIDSVIRGAALALLNQLTQLPNRLLAEEGMHDWRDNLFESVLNCDIDLLDDKSVSVVYDSHTRVDAVVPQAAWTLGLEDHETFELYELRGSKSLPISGNRFLTAVVNDDRFLNNGHEPSRLLMRRKIIRLLEKERNDAIGFRLTYCQVKQEYLASGYPLAIDQAIDLCVLLIKAENRSSDVRNDEELSVAVEEFIPSKTLIRRCRHTWLTDVRNEFNESKKIESSEAQFRFVDYIQFLPYGNCQFFALHGSGGSEPILRRHGSLQLAINRNGIHFFSESQDECLLTIELDCIESVDPANNRVYIRTRKRRSTSFFWLQTREREQLYDAIESHREIFLRETRKSDSSREAMDSSDMPLSDTTTGISLSDD